MSPSKSGTAQAATKITPASTALQSLKQKRRTSGVGWNDCESDKLLEVIQSVTVTGALISFSITSDGGAVSLFIKDGDDKENFYASSSEELEELIEHVHGAYQP